MADKNPPIHILSLEDSATDFELIENQLHRHLENIHITNVSAEHEFLSSLSSGTYDIILSDFNLQGFTAVEALTAATQICPETPFICLSGAIGEETAIEMLRMGAVDYVFKDKMDRLPFAITRALEEAEEKKNLRETEKALRETNELLSLFMQFSPIYSYIKEVTSTSSRVILASDNFIDMVGIAGSKMTGKTMEELFPPDMAAQITADDQNVVSQGKTLTIEEEYNGRFFTTIKFPISREGKTMLAGYTIDITQSKQYEKSLQESESRYRSILESAADAIIMLDSNGIIVGWNRSASRIFGYTEAEITGLNVATIMPEEFRETHQFRLKSLVNGAESKLMGSTVELTGLSKEGKCIPVELSLSEYSTSEGKFFTGIIRDITERKKVEEALQQSEKKYRTLFENVQDVFYQTTMDGVVIEISPSIQHLADFDRDVIMNNPISDLYYDKKDRDIFLKELSLSGEVRDYKLRLRTSSGEIRHASVNARLAFNENGIPDHIDGSIRDITKRVMDEETIKQSEAKFRSIFDDHAAVKLIIDPEDGLISEANESAAAFYGWSREELKSMPVYKLSISSQQVTRESFLQILKGIEAHFEFRHRRKDGSAVDVEVFSSKVLISGKEFIHFIIHDVSDKKKAEEQIRLLSKSIEQSPVTVVITDVEGTIQYANQAFANSTGYKIEEALGKNPRILKSGGQDPEFYKSMWDTITSGAEWNGEMQNKKKNGELYWEKASISPLLNENGAITHFVGIKEDITERRQMLEDLTIAKEKAEAGDRLKTAFINNISHEIRTPLNGIIGFSEMLMAPDLSEENKIVFNDIVKKSSARLLSTITSYMDISMIVSGNVPVNIRQFKPDQLLEDLQKEFLNACREKQLELTCTLPEDKTTLLLKTDEDNLRKIMEKLLDNAIKFTSSGAIEFGLRFSDGNPEFFVSDTGCGFEHEKIDMIFDKFVQADMSITRGYEGSGLGLSIANGLAKLLGGELNVLSEKDKGTEFSFRLPSGVLIEAAPAVKENKIRSTSGKIPTVLVAEDEDLNYYFLEILLSGSGYNVLRAYNGAEAVTICRENSAIDIVLMDVRMPVIDGFEATKLIRTFLPHIPVIAVTAYVSTKNETDALGCGCNDYISKPINTQLLLKKINALLGTN